MTEYLAPFMRVADANAAVAWYQRLGFVKEWEHRFENGFPLYVGMARGDLRMHLSEDTGDARPGTLVYLYVEDLDALAGTLGVTEIDDMPWVVISKPPTPTGITCGSAPPMFARMTKARSAHERNHPRERSLRPSVLSAIATLSRTRIPRLDR